MKKDRENEVEEIETVSFKSRCLPYFSFRFTECEGVISDLSSPHLLEPAIINGKPCTPGRRFTKASLEKIIEKAKEIQNEPTK